MTVFAILDPSLASYNGHFLTYDHAIATAANAQGLRSVTFSSAAILPNLPVAGELVPTFRDGLEHSFFRGPLTARAGVRINQHLLRRRFLADLNRALTPPLLGQNPILYMHTTTPAQIPPLVDWLAAHRHLAPTLVLMLRYAPSPNPYMPEGGQSAAYRAALAYAQNKGVEKQLRLVTDSAALVNAYKLVTPLPVHLLPIPHTALTPVSPPLKTAPLMTYLGNARATKGFHYLPHLVQALKPELARGAWAAEFQANVMSGRDSDSILAVKLLRRQPVALHEAELPIEDYNSLLLRSSLVLLPYQLLHYYAQTSGVLCEALAAGKPVVVPRGTWMAQQIEGRGVGETFLPGDRESFVEATKKAMGDIDRLRENAEAFRAEWASYHNPANFITELMKRVQA